MAFTFGLIRGMESSRGSGRDGRRASHTNRGGGAQAHSAAFGKTLQFITSIKLEELEKQRLAFEAHSAVLEKAAACGDDLVQRVELLLDAVRSWRGSGAVDSSTFVGDKLDLASLDLWLLQARKDPGFSPDVLKEWADTLEAHIRHCTTRFEFAKLFGGLFNEWLSSGDSVLEQDSESSPRANPSDEFVEVGRQALYEQQERLKSIIFEPKVIDTDALFAYLTDLFSDSGSLEVLESMRRGMKEFGEDLRSRIITSDDMKWVINSLLAADLMLEDKRNTLKEFAQSPTVLDELATVLTMRIGSLEGWAWPAHGAQVDMRRHLNGKYRAFTDPEMLDALFLQYLGIILETGIPPFLARPAPRPPDNFAESPANSLHSYRQTLRKDHFLVGQLASEVNSTPSYDDWGNPEKTQLPISHVKQELLHTVATECYLNSTLHETHTIVCTDLEWFGPSLAFDTVLTCLRFFGVSETWLTFFKAFLEVPLTFKEDKTGEAPRIRRCGTPISYALSTFFAEAVLFGLDFAVNHHANGLFLYRIHDDIWFWGSDSAKCVTAWAELKKGVFSVFSTFNALIFLTCVGADLAPELPSGEVRWGFLRFQSAQSRFVIDQSQVDEHIVELRRQLAATKSVFGFINAYNKYMAFFSRNFGARPTVSFGPALCLGQEHLDDMIDTLARIQKEVFPSSSGGAIGELRAIIAKRFGVRDLPDGYFYFPISTGGMELRNPLIELLAVRDAIGDDPASQFAKQMEKDTESYRALQEKWNSGVSGLTSRYDKFPPFEDYIAYRETGLQEWRNRYCALMSTSKPKQLRLQAQAQQVDRSMDFYDRWVLSLYGDQVLKKFGSLEVVDPTLIPVGLVHLFRGSRHQWDQ
ncbi:hypothetical protein MSAN_01410100 [Mycena sanguinolenta]|uniref:Reverse transcriptase n=1 Tax=Mycena sanguinolenta TaxID=230812 RepID=A0A8H6YBB7_9AGAR|nr:hypothetical protein MSAN_01410100 [Mycena sanguinolenta]